MFGRSVDKSWALLRDEKQFMGKGGKKEGKSSPGKGKNSTCKVSVMKEQSETEIAIAAVWQE